MADVASPTHRELKLTVPNGAVELVCDFIIDNIAAGLVLEEEEGASQTTIIFYPSVDDTDCADRLSKYLEGLIGDQLETIPEISERVVPEINWLEKYRQSVKPIRIGEDIVVRPTWADPVEGITYDVIIDPVMAFGTGSHATTRGSLLAVRARMGKGMRFLDMGTGSGILAILADKMGASYIKAVDYDQIAVDNSIDNFNINNVKAPHDILLGSIERCDGDQPYEFVCANIIKITILEMLERLIELTAPGGWLILSGLLEQDGPDIDAALRALGQSDFTIYQDEEWLTYTVHRS